MFDFNNTTSFEISKQIRQDEELCVKNLLGILNQDILNTNEIQTLARNIMSNLRKKRLTANTIDSFIQAFSISSEDGIALMSLSESLLRIPDKYTQNLIIKDKILSTNWDKKESSSLLIQIARAGILLTNKIFSMNDNYASNIIQKMSAPMILAGTKATIRCLGHNFVMSQNINDALKKAKAKESIGYRFSYDMLGEAALTALDAKKYFEDYVNAIHAVGLTSNGNGPIKSSGISVKLSALHPRYCREQKAKVQHELYESLKQLCLLAQSYNIGIFIDAEEVERLELSLDIFDKLLSECELKSFSGIGFVIQAYQKSCISVINHIIEKARLNNRYILVRLVKGAYWDSEIKRAQVDGLEYPVFTRKVHTDISYIVAAQLLLKAQDCIYPAFATHNAYTVALIYNMAKGKLYEFQCLYGMGESLYDELIQTLHINCRIYAPIGNYENLLPYLIRRLLENGANSSFVNKIADKNIDIESLILSPLELMKRQPAYQLKHFSQIYENTVNSKGIDIKNDSELVTLETELNKYVNLEYSPHSLYKCMSGKYSDIKHGYNPANLSLVSKTEVFHTEDIEDVLSDAEVGFNNWSSKLPQDRSELIVKFSDLLEENCYEIIALLVRESGKTIENAISELREAIDFCRYYGSKVLREFNNTTHVPLGITVCISPWNFPLAIFIGEVVASLSVGNSVIAKPSMQTNAIAYYAVTLMHKAGIPVDAIQLLLGSGSIIGDMLSKDKRVKAVIFTGSNETANAINKNISANGGVLIAETGGQNAMIVDSTALLEQAVLDVIKSGFDSAGQRCSALRVLYVQNEIADKLIRMLKGAMDELIIGDPMTFSTDIGPIIDKTAQSVLLEHIADMKIRSPVFYQAPRSSEKGIFIEPTLCEINHISELEQEYFGPIVHIIRYESSKLDAVIDEINSSGYGLTSGIHTRLNSVIDKVIDKVAAGNIYVNRNMVGAVVGVQPFGGNGLSGTGPKAGGPFYLYRLIHTKQKPQFLSKYTKPSFNELDTFVQSLSQFLFMDNELQSLVSLSEELKHETLLGHTVDLTGTTGEKNYMFFVPRGIIALYAENIYQLCKQIIYVLATKNKFVIVNETGLYNSYKCFEGYIVSENEIDLIHVALISKFFHNKYITSRIITNVIIQDNDGCYSLIRMVAEKSISINLTATGGNTDLMRIAE